MRAVIATDNSHCARCGAAFHCGLNDPEPCACSSLQLDAASLAALRARFTGCLCIACLSGLARTLQVPPAANTPT